MEEPKVPGFWQNNYEPSRAAMTIDPRAIRVPEPMQGANVETSITAVAMFLLVTFLLAVASVLWAKLKTERRAQSSLQTAIDAANQVTQSAVDQIKVGQDALRTAQLGFKTVLDGAHATFEKAFASQRASYEAVQSTMAARIVTLTDHLIKAGETADERVADAYEANEKRFDVERAQWRASLGEVIARSKAAAHLLEPHSPISGQDRIGQDR